MWHTHRILVIAVALAAALAEGHGGAGRHAGEAGGLRAGPSAGQPAPAPSDARRAAPPRASSDRRERASPGGAHEPRGEAWSSRPAQDSSQRQARTTPAGVAVASARRAPGGAAASSATRAPRAPYVELLGTRAGIWSLRIVASESTGELLLAGADGEIFARYAVPPRAGAQARALDLELSGLAEGDGVRVAHELSGQRRSAWRSLELIANSREGEANHVP